MYEWMDDGRMDDGDGGDDDEDFIKEVETAMQSWTETRQRGLAGIEE